MNKSRTNWIVGTIIVILIIIFAVARPRPSESNVIKVGYFGPFTGPVAGTTGEDVGNAFKLAASLQNMIGDKKVQVIYEDDACDPQKAVSAATKLMNINKVKILVNGVCSGSTLAVAPLAEKNKVILFTPVSTSPKITDAGDYVFRISSSDIAAGQATASLSNKLGFTKVAILIETTDFTVGVKDAFLKFWNSVQGNVVTGTDSIGSKDPDIRTPLVKLVATKPDAIFLVMNSAVTALASIKQARDLGIKIPIIGDAYFAYKEVVKNPLAEGVYSSQYKYDQNNPALVSFLKSYQDTYHKDPGQDIYAGLGYDGYNVLFNAIKSCGNDNSDCIKQALYNTKNYQGVTGTITIDQNGDTQREFTLKRIHNGALEDIK